VYIYPTEPVYTKRKRNIDKKKIVAPYGTIVSCSTVDEVRGLDLRKKKKKKTESSIVYFRNTVTIEMAYKTRDDGSTILINILIFNNCMKISGCKSVRDAMEVVMVLWETYMAPAPGMWRITAPPLTTPRFLFEVVMQNYDVRFGFDIDRDKLNRFMNQAYFADWIAKSQFEATIHTNVNIKTYARPPKVVRYHTLTYSGGTARHTYSRTNPYHTKVSKKKNNTFTVFSTSETKISGRHRASIRHDYKKFVHIIQTHKEEIMERYKDLDAFVEEVV
jgi:hypothetical protein